MFMCSHVSGGFLQTAETWANAGVCSASCAHALDSMFVCLFWLVCLFVCLVFSISAMCNGIIHGSIM